MSYFGDSENDNSWRLNDWRFSDAFNVSNTLLISLGVVTVVSGIIGIIYSRVSSYNTNSKFIDPNSPYHAPLDDTEVSLTGVV